MPPRFCYPDNLLAAASTSPQPLTISSCIVACGRLDGCRPAIRHLPQGECSRREASTGCTSVVTCGTGKERLMSKLIHELDQASIRSDIPAFRPGDTVKVHVKVVEGTRRESRSSPVW